MRSYLELDMFTSLTLQTETTLRLGQEELIRFEQRLKANIILGNCYSTLLTLGNKEYSALRPDKGWNFPKAHTHQHVFQDILTKGVTRNYNTKPNEKLNGPLKKFYQNHTNFKNVASQVSSVPKCCACTNVNHYLRMTHTCHTYLHRYSELMRWTSWLQ